jgi:hypothetical protein
VTSVPAATGTLHTSTSRTAPCVRGAPLVRSDHTPPPPFRPPPRRSPPRRR